MSSEAENAPDQDDVIATLRERVDAWRGFALDNARQPYGDPGRYEPTRDGEHLVSATTLELLQHWFRPEPHEVRGVQGLEYFKYWPHQRRAVETFVFLHEVLRVRCAEQIWAAGGVEPSWKQQDPWPKLGAQLATGAGKTKVMSLLVAWTYLNAVREPTHPLGLGCHVLIIAPGLFVRDRLLQDFLPPDDSARSVFALDPVIPPSMERDWHLSVYSPQTCPRRLDPLQGALVVTNYHQLLRKVDVSLAVGPKGKRQPMLALFEDVEPAKLEATDVPLIERFSRSKGVLVINDEAHHVWDESGHQEFEAREKKQKADLKKDDAFDQAMAWIGALRKLHGTGTHNGRLGLQVDLSATLYEESGAVRKLAKGRGGRDQVKFRATDLFRHTTVRYDLSEAIRDGIVKRPVLERIVAKKKDTGEPEPLVRDGAPNAWEKFRNLLVPGIRRWRELRKLHEVEGGRKPILFLLCSDRSEATEVANFLRYGIASKEDVSGNPLTGFKDSETGEVLFLDVGSNGVPCSTVAEVHIGSKEQSNEKEWNKIRATVNQIDRDEIADPNGARDAFGRSVLIPNPYNVVISVMMLKEGWDVRNVQVIVPLRPCDSRTLTEQILGRGLRKMHSSTIDENGAATMSDERLYVIEHPSFESVIDQIKDLVEQEDSDKIAHKPEYVAVTQRDDDASAACDVRMVCYEGQVEIVQDWRDVFDVGALSPLKPRRSWRGEFSETEIETYLKEAMKAGEELGMRFTLSIEPSYRDFDHVIEAVYVVPLLKRLHKSYQYKNAVKSVVREFLEQRTFDLPAGIPISFEASIKTGATAARIAMANLARKEVSDAVIAALVAPLREAMSKRLPSSKVLLTHRWASEVPPFQAQKKHVFETPKRSVFTRTAMDSGDEVKVAALLDKAEDVLGWVYNHSKVGYSIEYEWQGRIAKYVPDFVVRAKIGKVEHNVIVEAKGRFDDRDKAKARRGVAYARLLTETDARPWHYVFLIENPPLKRKDISWWASQSITRIEHLLRRHEMLPLIPSLESSAQHELKLVNDVSKEDEFVRALPVVDLVAAAGGFSQSQAPEPLGWLPLVGEQSFDRQCFVARMEGPSMQTSGGDGVPDGAWVLFRRYDAVPAMSAGFSYSITAAQTLTEGADTR